MNFSMFFGAKIIPALRKVFGQNNVQASSTTTVDGISGVIITPEGECNIIFRVREDAHGLILNLNNSRTDVMKTTVTTEDPSTIAGHIVDYANEWKGVEQFGRVVMRAEELEASGQTLTGLKPSEYDGISDLTTTEEPDFSESDETGVKAIK